MNKVDKVSHADGLEAKWTSLLFTTFTHPPVICTAIVTSRHSHVYTFYHISVGTTIMFQVVVKLFISFGQIETIMVQFHRLVLPHLRSLFPFFFLFSQGVKSLVKIASTYVRKYTSRSFKPCSLRVVLFTSCIRSFVEDLS